MPIGTCINNWVAEQLQNMPKNHTKKIAWPTHQDAQDAPRSGYKSWCWQHLWRRQHSRLHKACVTNEGRGWTLLGAPDIATRNKKLLGAPGLTTRNKKPLETRTKAWVDHLFITSSKTSKPWIPLPNLVEAPHQNPLPE